MKVFLFICDFRNNFFSPKGRKGSLFLVKWTVKQVILLNRALERCAQRSRDTNILGFSVLTETCMVGGVNYGK